MTKPPEPPRLLTMPEGGYAISRLTQSFGGPSDSSSGKPTNTSGRPEKLAYHGPPTLDAVVESLLFVGAESDQPTPSQKLLKHLPGVAASQIESSIERINYNYQERDAPYRVASSEGGWKIEGTDEHRAIALRLAGRDRETKLTRAALEVLSVVAYRGPTTGEELSRFRGKQSGAVLRQLVRQGLLRAEHTKNNRGRAARAYAATAAVASLLGLSSLDDLPKTPEKVPIVNKSGEPQVP